MLLGLTPAGEVMVNDIYQQAVAHVDSMLTSLSAADRAVLHRGLTILRTVLADADGD